MGSRSSLSSVSSIEGNRQKKSEINISNRCNYIIKWQNSNMDYLKNGVFLNESGFLYQLKTVNAMVEKSNIPISNVASTNAITHSVLDIMTSKDKAIGTRTNHL
ncbi:hypothetical protein BCR42DRAFT_403633 [Absidia repens]|uniref:Uncharacterized protein n=1 Tax=Absidia repens TaxID=90262 RepID=A0A1X2IVC1_9FUNG|nr:hypothetical protein BCR42DRAFT_403633 [Absidia repens]